MKIEASAGVQTSHDGPDGGEDDDTLQSVVDAVLGGEEPARQSPVAGMNNHVLDAEMDGACNRPDKLMKRRPSLRSNPVTSTARQSRPPVQ